MAKGTLVEQVLERALRPGEVSLDDLERAFRETATEVEPAAPAPAAAPAPVAKEAAPVPEAAPETRSAKESKKYEPNWSLALDCIALKAPD